MAQQNEMKPINPRIKTMDTSFTSSNGHAFVIEYKPKEHPVKRRVVALTAESAVNILVATLNKDELEIFWNKTSEKKLLECLKNKQVENYKQVTILDMDIYKVTSYGVKA